MQYNRFSVVNIVYVGTLSLDNVHLVNNSEKGLMMSPRSTASASLQDMVAKDVWWPSPNCGPKEVYVD